MQAFGEMWTMIFDYKNGTSDSTQVRRTVTYKRVDIVKEIAKVEYEQKR